MNKNYQRKKEKTRIRTNKKSLGMNNKNVSFIFFNINKFVAEIKKIDDEIYEF